MRRKGELVLLEKMKSLITHHHHSLPPILSSSSSNMSTPSAVPPCPIAQQKKSLRSTIKKQLGAFPPSRRTQEDMSIQNVVLDSPWFRSASRLCAYISCESLREVDTSRILSQVLKQHDTDGHKQVKKKLYVPRVEDKNSHMRMFNISSIDDLVTSSMNILEPSPTDANGDQLEDGNYAGK
ncbi:5-formyltetrahydrofolate cyclo-ligase, mitochondrial isoform X1 [Iris pallida]|uniref:5-formyltetrahydrofolate cyclo-ligase n=1 Tax=Iris pallida TaxID=29817 RepID=A0AAX6GDI3_IRIPA|nr:5-formyltetrahydrofolate cyclo-ligase, mitochondrial isoform X1 [Iris pallida]